MWLCVFGVAARSVTHDLVNSSRSFHTDWADSQRVAFLSKAQHVSNRWPFVESELENANILGWLMPILTLGACYYVDESALASLFLLAGVGAGALLVSFVRRTRWQNLVVFLWALSPIAFVILELRISAYLDHQRSPQLGQQERSGRSPRLHARW
jgi:hypothetical protein